LMDWHKVAVDLNSQGHEELDIAQRQGSRETAKEFRIRGYLLISLANALFKGLEEDAEEVTIAPKVHRSSAE